MIALGALLLVACGGDADSRATADSPAATPSVHQEPVSKTAPQDTSVAKAPAHEALARDVILITIDTWRADAAGFSGNPAASTPHLDRLAAEGRVFDRAYAHNVVTLPSHANILTGLYPHQHGVRENSGFVLGERVPTVASVLLGEGWATGAFIGAFPLDSRFGLDRGFEVYDDDYPKGSDRDKFLPAERRGDEVVSLAAVWWRENAARPRFLWVHVYDPHAPYAPPSPFAERFAERPYLGEVAATDAFLAPLFELARAASQPPLVVVTADHGEALGDHGELTHGLFCYDATLHVPLVLWGAGVSAGRDERLAAHVDLVPTILDAAGVAPPSGLAGRSLLAPPATGERRIYFEALTTFFNRGWAPLRGVVAGDGAVLEKMIELPVPELYDLAADPAEADNLFAAERSRFDRLRSTLRAEAEWPPARQKTFSAEEARMLRSLGYLSSRGARQSGFTVEDDPKNLVEVDRDLHRAIAAYSTGHLERAVKLTRQVIAQRPDMAPSYELLALSLRQLERPREAAAVLEAAVERGLADESMLRQLGLTYSENGLAKKAVEVLSPFAESDDLEMLAALGIALSDAARHDAALEVLRRAEKIDPEDPRVLETLGVVTLRLGQAAAAEAYLDRALAQNDNLPFSWNTLGVARAYQGRFAAAVEAWERALELDAEQWDALYNLGMTAKRIGAHERARRALERYVAEAPPERFATDIAEARRVLSGLR